MADPGEGGTRVCPPPVQFLLFTWIVLGELLVKADWSVPPKTRILNIFKNILLVNSVIFCFRLTLAKYHHAVFVKLSPNNRLAHNPLGFVTPGSVTVL